MLSAERATMGPLKIIPREDSFSALLEPLLESAYRFACGMLHDPQAAEDAVQEASIRAWRRLSQLRSPEAVRPWFLSIVANQCRTTSRGRWWSVIKSAAPEPQPPPEGVGAASALDLRRAIRRLPHRQRTALVMYFYLDLDEREIAAATNSTPGAVKRQLYRSLAKLRPY